MDPKRVECGYIQPVIAPLNMFWHWFALWFLAVNVREDPIGPELDLICFRAIGCISPNLARAIVLCQNRRQFMAIILCGIGCCLTPDKAPFMINGNLGLVTKMRHRDINQPCVFISLFGLAVLAILDHPARVCVLLCGFGWIVRPDVFATSPAFARPFSSFVMRWRGAAISETPTICPPTGL